VIELRLLGPVELLVDGGRVALPAKPRALLVLLALNANRPVSTDRIVDELWPDDPPERAVKTVQVYVSQLRKALGPGRLETADHGYKLVLADDEVDLRRFERLLQEGREHLARGEAADAVATLEAALGLWHGDAPTLDELRAAALEERAEAELALGRHAQLVAELERLVAERPERERPRAQLMLALYRSGRQEEALALFRRTREDLVERLGIEPGPELRELHSRILQQDPELTAPPPVASPAASPAPPRAHRRRRTGVIAGVLVAAATAAGLALALAGGGGSSSHDAGLESYVLKVENFLGQSHDARGQISTAVAAARACRMGSARAAAVIDRVTRSRQSLLDQLAALAVPSDRNALHSFDLLQRAAQASITADWSYRDWLRARRRCVHGAAPPAAVGEADARATRAKTAFVDAFTPLARRFHAREWGAGDF
jgi:DNA-binding SARP family transcriptional activator